MPTPHPHDHAQDPPPSFMRPRAEPSAARGLLVLIVLGAMAYGAYRLHEAPPDAWGPAPPPAQQPAPAPAARPETPTPPMVTAPQAATPTTAPAPTPSRATAVTKCVGPGGVQYSDGPCPPGTQASQLHIHPRQNVADGLRQPPMALVAPVAAASATPPAMGVAQPSEAPDPGATCEALNRRVEYLDQVARMPQSASAQDGLREQRKQARDEQFRLRCR